MVPQHAASAWLQDKAADCWLLAAGCWPLAARRHSRLNRPEQRGSVRRCWRRPWIVSLRLRLSTPRQPNNRLYTFEGTLTMAGTAPVPIDANDTVLHGPVASCNHMYPRLQPYVPRLQPHLPEAATICTRGCHHMYPRLPPHVPEAATAWGAWGCSLSIWGRSLSIWGCNLCAWACSLAGKAGMPP